MWIKGHKIQTLPYPPQSPDLKTSENLCNLIRMKTGSHKPLNKSELIEYLQQERHKVTQEQRKREHAKT